jgi:dihydroorotase
MLADGVVPDVISSDIHQESRLGPMYDLPTTLAKFMHLGLSLDEVIARATYRPARAMGRPDLGTLSAGVMADIALFRVEEGDYTFYDIAMVARRATRTLRNMATYVGGSLLPRTPERLPAPWVERFFSDVQRPLLRESLVLPQRRWFGWPGLRLRSQGRDGATAVAANQTTSPDPALGRI